jgi:hypothetical protein
VKARVFRSNYEIAEDWVYNKDDEPGEIRKVVGKESMRWLVRIFGI